jgi:shikimate kinase
MTRLETGRPIAIVGLTGAGKSAVARRLGERHGVSVGDLDALLEAEEGCTIAELFERQGEPYFRRRERELLARALGAGVRILACGGGVVVDAAARRMLRERCRVVWLEVAPAVAAARVAGTVEIRPLLRGSDAEPRLAALLAERAPWYAEVSDVRVVTDGRTADEVADAVDAALAAGG